MININLLDWREKYRVIQNNRLIAFVIMAAIVGVLFALITDFIIKRMISNHQEDVVYLTSEVSAVEQKINQIQDLETQKETLLDRRKIIESLQDTRSFVVKIFDNLPRVVPPGVTLTEMVRKGDQLTLSGTAYNNSLVSDFMLALQRLKWITDAKLTDLKSSSTTDQKKRSDNSGATSSGGTNMVTFQISIALLNTAVDIPQPEAAKGKNASVSAAVPAAVTPEKKKK